MKSRLYALFLFLLILAIALCTAAPSPDLLDGPFPSWLNAKTGYNAKGDGSTDDGPALQNALNALVSTTTSRVLYIPAGTYRITKTLTFSNMRNCAIIGEDPATTILKWDGTTDTSMLTVTGVAMCRYSRLTFEGSSKVKNGFLYQWLWQYNFPAELEFSDLWFQNMQIGLNTGPYVGTTNENTICEAPIIRCRFVNCTRSGIYVADANTADLFARFCLFQNCGTGVELVHQGGICVYQNVFKNNTLDIQYSGNFMWGSIRNNYSSGSGHFYSGVNKVTIANNTIISPATSNVINSPSQYSWMLLLDNIIQSPANATSAINIGSGSASGAKLVSVGNTFTVANYNASPTTRTTIRSIGDKVVDRSTLTLTEPVLPSTPVKFTGPVIEPTAMTGAAIQAAIITAATTYKGQKPVVHLKTGNYTISNKIVIPANCDVRLVGDHGSIQNNTPMGTRLTWTGAANDTILLLKSPSRAELKELFITAGSNNKPYGIFIDKADQPGARVFLDQFEANEYTISNTVGLLADGLDNCVVESWHGHPGGYQNCVVSRGGPRTAAGDTTTTSRVDLFGNGFNVVNSPTTPMWDVQNNGRLMVQDPWSESGNTRYNVVKLGTNSSGTLTLSGGKNQFFNTAEGTTPTHTISGFKGTFTMIGYVVNDGVMIASGNEPQQNVLCMLSSFAPNGSGPLDNGGTFSSSATAGTNIFWLNEFYGTYGTANPQPQEVGTPTDAWLLKMLKQLRTEQPSWDIADLPTGVTDVRIWRVGTDFCLNALTVKGGGDVIGVKHAGFSNQVVHQLSIKKTVPGMDHVSLPLTAKQVSLFDCKGKTLATITIDKSEDLSRATARAIAAAGQKVVLIKTQE